jgi:hypothetical protein
MRRDRAYTRTRYEGWGAPRSGVGGVCGRCVWAMGVVAAAARVGWVGGTQIRAAGGMVKHRVALKVPNVK